MRNPAIIKAAAAGNIKSLKNLAKKQHIDEKGWNNDTPLSVAAWKGHITVVEYLFSQGADIENKNKDGYTPLLESVKHNKVKVTQFLLSKGANVEHTNRYGRTGLDYITESDGMIFAFAEHSIFKRRGLSCITKLDNMTILHLAAIAGDFKSLRMLMKRQKPYTLDNTGNTPLMSALLVYDKKNERISLIKCLFDMTQDCAVKNIDGQNILRIAKDMFSYKPGREYSLYISIIKQKEEEQSSNLNS